MSIKFEYGSEAVEGTLASVEEDQFFINFADALCQKIDNNHYNVLAVSGGQPCAYTTQVDDFFGLDGEPCESRQVVKQILPRVKRIYPEY